MYIGSPAPRPHPSTTSSKRSSFFGCGGPRAGGGWGVGREGLVRPGLA